MRFDRLTKVDLYFSPRHGGEIVLFCRPTFTDIFGFVPLAPPRVIFRVIRREFGAMAYFVGNVIMPAVIGIDAQFTLFFGGPAVYRPGIVGVKPWASKPVGVLAQPTNCDIGGQHLIGRVVMAILWRVARRREVILILRSAAFLGPPEGRADLGIWDGRRTLSAIADIFKLFFAPGSMFHIKKGCRPTAARGLLRCH